jgi:RHS repeat-associated protein
VSIYDTVLYSQQPYQEVDLIMPDGGRVHFVRIVPGVGYFDAVFESTAQGEWYKARIQRNNTRSGWDLILRDGARWFFYEYQAVKEMIDASGNATIITRRDNNGYSGPITRVQSPSGRYVDFTLDTSGRVTQAKDNLGRIFTYVYDASGRLTKVTDPLLNERNYTWDASNRLATVKDPRNIVATTNQYDANSRVTLQTLADSNTFQFAYTVVNGKVTQTDVTDQRGKVRRVAINANGFIASSTAAYGTADAQTTTFVRDANGQITSTTDPLGRVTTATYDGWGNRTSVTRLYGTSNAVTTSYTYTPGGERLASVSDPLSHTTSFTYDSRWNLLTATDPLTHTVTYTRDAQGRVLTMTDALNHTWTYAYSGADLASVTDPLGRVVQVFSDAVGRVTRTVDPLGNATTFEFDMMGRMTKATDALAGVVQYGFDANGNLTSHKDQKNNTTTYAFNNLSLVSGKTDALNNSETYLYGANGRVTQITDRKSQVSGITYDNLNRVSQVGFGATPANPTAYTSTIGYTFDAGNRTTQIVDSANGTITRTFDGLDRVTQEQTPEGTVSYTYDNASRRATMTVAGQASVNYTWDNADRLTQIAQGTDTIAFSYDNADRRTSTTLANGVVMAYAWDNANQLTSITYTKPPATIGDLQYTYDNAGRRTKITGSLAASDLPTAVASALYNANNQLTSWGGATQTYDLNGNLTGDGTKTLTWNARDQLASISGGISASFGYDGTGRRKSKTVSGTQTGFLYDGLNFVQELNGSTPTANLITGEIDELFQRKEGSTASSAITDALGTVIGLTDSAGALQTQYSFEPYGKTTSSGAANNNSQKYTAREDDATGLLYYRARYHAPVSGRFVSEDPIGIGGGTNSYIYVENNPVLFADPTGLLLGFNAGESYGDSAAQYWADLANREDNNFFAFMGGIASLWSSCTSDKTALTLVGGYAFRVLGPFSSRAYVKALPKPIQKLRSYVRFDKPEHGKGWQFDGKIPNWIRNKMKDHTFDIGMSIGAGASSSGANSCGCN